MEIKKQNDDEKLVIEISRSDLKKLSESLDDRTVLSLEVVFDNE